MSRYGKSRSKKAGSCEEGWATGVVSRLRKGYSFQKGLSAGSHE